MKVLGQLLSLCILDEPRGSFREMSLVYVRLVREMHSSFLAHQCVVRAITQLLQFAVRAAGHTPADDVLIELVHSLALRLRCQPELLRPYTELGAAYTITYEEFPMFALLLYHLDANGTSGFHVRSAVLHLLSAMIQLSYKANTEQGTSLLLYVSRSDLTRLIAEAACHALASLPLSFDSTEKTGEGEANEYLKKRFPVLAEFWCTSLITLVPLKVQPTLCTLLDLVWLADQVDSLCRLYTPILSYAADRIEHVQAELMERMQNEFMDFLHQTITRTSKHTTALLCYIAMCLSVVEPRGTLARMICLLPDGEKGFFDLVSASMNGSDLQCVCALHLATLYMQRRLQHDAVRGTALSRSRPCSLALMSALSESMQTPSHLGAMPRRLLLHLHEVEGAMIQEARLLYGDWSKVLQESISMNDYFMKPILEMLRHWFCAPLLRNVAVSSFIAAFCRSPHASLEGWIAPGEHPPVLTFIFFMLVKQTQEFARHIPDFAFYASKRKQQRLHISSEANSQTTAHTFASNMSSTEELNNVNNLFYKAGWLSATSPSTSYTMEPLTNVMSRSSHDGAEHIIVTVYPCQAPTSSNLTLSESFLPCNIRLVDLLDNVLLLDEFLMELTCIAQLRRAWAIDLV